MAPARFRPEIRVPWPALAVFAVVVYVTRSGLRGWDFVPDSTDLLVFGLFAVLLLLRPLVAGMSEDADGEDDAPHA